MSAMKIIFIFTIVAFLTGLSSAAKNGTACESGYWGDGCTNVCGECYIPTIYKDLPKCDPDNGQCQHGCLGRYTGSLCDQPICKEGCGSGKCLAPDYCGDCGDISKVSPFCEDIRIRGLAGSIGAFIILTASISLCGLGTVYYKQKNKHQKPL